MEVRLLSVGTRGFFLAASQLALAVSPLNSVAHTEKKTSGTQGNSEVKVLEKVLMKMLVCSLQIISRLDSQSKFQAPVVQRVDSTIQRIG